MSYDVNNRTITIDDTTYNVADDYDGALARTRFTLMLDDEPVFEGIEASVDADEDASWCDPRKSEANVGTMHVDYPGYRMGDDDAPDPRGRLIACPECNGNGEIDPECPKCDGLSLVSADPIEWLRREHGARIILPLFVYEHSGITMRCGDPIGRKIKPADFDPRRRFVGDDAGWDTSMVGFIFDTPERVKECIGKDATDEQIIDALRCEVRRYAAWLEGDVWGYCVSDSETGYFDSCGGFIGSYDDCLSECFESIELAIRARLNEMRERQEMAARDIVTV